MSNNSPCRSPTRTADRCVGDGANRKKRDLCAPSVHLRSSTPATRPRRTPRATSKKQQGLGIGVTCHLRPRGPRSPRHFWYLRVGIRTPGARGPPVQCRSRPLSAPADITAPVDASVSPSTIPPAQRVWPAISSSTSTSSRRHRRAPAPMDAALLGGGGSRRDALLLCAARLDWHAAGGALGGHAAAALRGF